MMPLANLHATLSEARADKERRQVIWRLVSALETEFNIQPGDALVFALGTGLERDNREALHTWVERRIGSMDPKDAVLCKADLIDELGRLLCNWEHDRWY